MTRSPLFSDTLRPLYTEGLYSRRPRDDGGPAPGPADVALIAESDGRALVLESDATVALLTESST